jgi:hypothetical protein
MSYTRLLTFYFLEWIGTSINLLCSLVKYYPSVDLGVNFLLAGQSPKINAENRKQAERRQMHEQKADKKLSESGFDDGKDI